MEKDASHTALFAEAEAVHRALRQPGTNKISDAAELSVSPDGQFAVFTATVVSELRGTPSTRIAAVDLTAGNVRELTSGPHSDKMPKFSPDGRQVALLSDRKTAGRFQPYLMDWAGGTIRPVGSVQGWVEYLHWSPDGYQLLFGVAGDEADLPGSSGAKTCRWDNDERPSWRPLVDYGSHRDARRQAWIYDLKTDTTRELSADGYNIWEAVWHGGDSILAIASSGATEGDWYRSDLVLIDAQNGATKEFYRPQGQIGVPAATACGGRIAFVEGLSSDRGVVVGDLRLIHRPWGDIESVDTLGVDVSHLEWRPNGQLMVTGHRGLRTVVSSYDPVARTFKEVWSSQVRASVGICATSSALPSTDDCVLVGEGFLDAPEIALIHEGRYRTIASFDHGYGEMMATTALVEALSWKASDGLDIEGWLLRPRGTGPFPLIMYVHGGPVGQWRPTWLGRRHAPALMFLRRGYAIFFPNPRGSFGWGQAFARKVLGDLGGADAEDCLSGIDDLIAKGIADPERLGVSGGSYGGFMTCWLVSQSTRFAAAVAVSPATNHVTSHLLSNIPQFVALFLADCYRNRDGPYYTRSPVLYAHQVKTPTLSICGGLDRCTPPQEAAQFHRALVENDAISALVTYPEEGHGIRAFPALIDYAARVVDWFERHMMRLRT